MHVIFPHNSVLCGKTKTVYLNVFEGNESGCTTTIVCAGYHNLPAIAKPPKQPARQDNTAKDKNIYSTAIA